MPKALADQYATTLAFQKKINKRIDRLKAKLKIVMAKTGGEVVYGTEYDIVYAETKATILKTDKVRLILTPTQVAQCEESSTRTHWTPRKRVKNTARMSQAA